MKLPRKYRRIIVDTVDKGLEGILGKTIKEIVYAYMKHEYDLDKDAYYDNIERFIKALREIIGFNASMIIENLVVKQLFESLSLKDVDERSSLLDLVEKMKSLELKAT